MKQSFKSWGKIALPLTFLLGILAAQLLRGIESFGGRKYQPAKPEDLAQLRRHAYEATPLLEAVKAFQTDHGFVPDFAQLEDSTRLTAAYRATCLDESNGWHYVRDGKAFRLYLKLGWDPLLTYDSISRQWEYDPGDGHEPTIIEM